MIQQTWIYICNQRVLTGWVPIMLSLVILMWYPPAVVPFNTNNHKLTVSNIKLAMKCRKQNIFITSDLFSLGKEHCSQNYPVHWRRRPVERLSHLIFVMRLSNCAHQKRSSSMPSSSWNMTGPSSKCMRNITIVKSTMIPVLMRAIQVGSFINTIWSILGGIFVSWLRMQRRFPTSESIIYE